jgi:hypothetical protein
VIRNVIAAIIFLATGASAEAALVSRLSGAAYYDDVLDITWLADANLADTNDFGVLGINADGSMSWTKANEWVAAMGAANYLGAADWRLPTVTDTGAAGCDFGYTGTDCGYNVAPGTGEMSQLFYSTLGNPGGFNTAGVGQPCNTTGPNFCLFNTGPFANVQVGTYWSGTQLATNTASAWFNRFTNGNQNVTNKAVPYFAWAVRTGDIALVPVPAAAWLFGGALGLLGLARRRVPLSD